MNYEVSEYWVLARVLASWWKSILMKLSATSADVQQQKRLLKVPVLNYLYTGFLPVSQILSESLHAHSDRSVGAVNKGQAPTGSPARVKTDRPCWAQMIRYYVFITKLWSKDAACLYAGRVPPTMEPDTAGKVNDDDNSVIQVTYEPSGRHFWGRNCVSGAAEALSPEKVHISQFAFRSISSGCQRVATEIQPPFG